MGQNQQPGPDDLDYHRCNRTDDGRLVCEGKLDEEHGEGACGIALVPDGNGGWEPDESEGDPQACDALEGYLGQSKIQQGA